jgi:uncharacterized membrane protein
VTRYVIGSAERCGVPFDASGSALAMLWRDGVTNVIGALPGHLESHGSAINNTGQIVGQSCAPSGWPDCSVFLWDKGIMRDLNDFVSDSSLTLVESRKINDLGQIVGIAFTSIGELHVFLGTPVTTSQTTRKHPRPLQNRLDPRPLCQRWSRKRFNIGCFLNPVILGFVRVRGFTAEV